MFGVDRHTRRRRGKSSSCALLKYFYKTVTPHGCLFLRRVLSGAAAAVVRSFSVLVFTGVDLVKINRLFRKHERTMGGGEHSNIVAVVLCPKWTSYGEASRLNFIDGRSGWLRT